MFEITFELEKNSKEPLYIQLYTYLREEIKANRIKKGTKLPSIRELSKYLEVSKITIDNAYQQLLVEGYIESKERSGMYVLEIEEQLTLNKQNINTKTNPISSFDKTYKYDFSHSRIDTNGFNFNLWRKFTLKVLQSSNINILDYGDRQGEWELRIEIAKYLRSSRGVLCNADQVIITAGTQNSIELLCRLTEKNHRSITIEDPGWKYAKFMFEKNNFNVSLIPVDKNGLQVEKLEKNPTKLVYVTPSHQFPSGVIMPITTRQNLLNWAEKNNSFIIEDDYDSEFRYSGRPIPALQSLNPNHVIYLGTFSKSLAPSLRMSYMIMPNKILEKYKENIYIYEQPVSKINQMTLYHFMSNGYWDRHIRKMRRIYSKKHSLLLKVINKYLNKNIKITNHNAGLHILLEIQNGMTEKDIIKKSEKLEIKIYPVSMYTSDKMKSTYPQFLMGFGGLSENEIENGIKLLGNVLKLSN